MVQLTPTREKIIQTATTLFAERGYFGVSMQELAASLGISKAALYYHFPGKEQLFLQAVEKVFAELLEKIREATRRARNPAEALVSVLETYLSFTLERPEASLLRHPSPESGGLEKTISRTLVGLNRQLKSFFEELFADAARSETDQRQALREAVEMLLTLFGRPRSGRKSQVKKTVALLLRPFRALLKK